MDRLQFQPDPADDIAALYRRLVGDELTDEERGARQAAWEAMTAALLRVLDAAEAFGLGAVELDALDVELVAAARLAAHGQRVAFAAGLRAGAALGGLHGPSVN
jgi:hypothetical protein